MTFHHWMFLSLWDLLQGCLHRKLSAHFLPGSCSASLHLFPWLIFKHFPLCKHISIHKVKQSGVLLSRPSYCLTFLKTATTTKSNFYKTYFLSHLGEICFLPRPTFFSLVLFFVWYVSVDILLHCSSICGSLHHSLWTYGQYNHMMVLCYSVLNV